jgi:hypothetical protein
MASRQDILVFKYIDNDVQIINNTTEAFREVRDVENEVSTPFIS